MAAILTAAAAVERDTRLNDFTATVIDGHIAAFDDIATRYRGVAPTTRYGIWTGYTSRRGVLELPFPFVQDAYAVDADSARRVADAATATSTALTSATAAFTSTDVGSLVIGEGIVAGTTISTVTNGTTVVLSQATTATASNVVVTIGPALTVDKLDEAEGRLHLCWHGRATSAFRHGLTSQPAALLDACTEYVLCVARSRAAGVSRNTLSEATDAGTTRYSTPDWGEGRPTGWLEVDRLLNTLPDYRVSVF